MSMHARVTALQDIPPDTRILRVVLDDGARLDFLPGQYVFLGAPGVEARAFSIATAPGAEALEFHIRDSGQGFSAHAVRALKTGDILTLEGPFGTNVLRDDDRPVLAVAGGLGIAPLKSIVEARLQSPRAGPVTLYWSARGPEHHYLDAHFQQLARRHARFTYVPLVAAEAPALNVADLKDFNIYMAGPRAMTGALLPALLEKGAARERIFSDAFSA
jgi:NAD(P)H-flavin reductase